MNELYEAIEAKIKESGYPGKFPVKLFTTISATRSRARKMEIMYCSPNLRRMSYLNTTSPSRMRI